MNAKHAGEIVRVNLNGDKNIIHGKADEHNVDDDEPLTSADFGRRHRPSRNYPDMGGRKS